MLSVCDSGQGVITTLTVKPESQLGSLGSVPSAVMAAAACTDLSSRESSEECNGLRGLPPVPPALARSTLPKLSAQPLQATTAMGDGLDAGSSQNPPSAPPLLGFNPIPPETWSPSRPKRQTNQLQVEIFEFVCTCKLRLMFGLPYNIFYDFSVFSTC